ncbi:MAG: lipocalin-like domain-containing protein [Anaerolineales bacterium]
MSVFRKMLPIALMLVVAAAGCAAPEADARLARLELIDLPGSSQAFERALEPIPIQLPRDHGPHESFQTEWWYYTGNLLAQDGHRFGYQFTIFRRGLTPGEDERAAGFATSQVYFAHLALTDVYGGDHVASERFSRGAAGLAGAAAAPFHAWLENWSVVSMNASGSRVRLQASDASFSLDFVLEAEKPLTLHGERGLSAKSEAKGNASYYLSYTRMSTTGTLSVGQTPFVVEGNSWFDHEWSTSVLDAADEGWDWFGLQLSDGRDLMLYLIRRSDGSLESVSGGTLVEPDGRSISLEKGEFQITIQRTWTSPSSGAVYPAAWQIEIPAYGLSLEIAPLVQDQELRVSFPYWEGAVEISGTSSGMPVNGSGYVELTGYDQDMGGIF